MTAPVVLRTPGEVAGWRPDGPLGLVPTMGALHAGHASLIARAAAECTATIVSIFVNPTQFNDAADLAHYPRPFARDVAVAGQHGATAIYAPAVEAIYPAGHASTVRVAGVPARWEGAHRPGHFDGVATVVAILLNQIRPDRSYFGEKDWQQLTMVRRMVSDLSLPGAVVTCPLVRDGDGLALSSRNTHLSADERRAALAIPRALEVMRNQVATGERDVATLIDAGRAILASESTLRVDYLAVVDPVTLEPRQTIIGNARVLVAAWSGATRLIDTMGLPVDDGEA